MDTTTTHTLVQFSAARAALAKACTLDEVKEIRDKAEALRAYAKQAGESLEMQNQCAEIKLRAERKAGGLLAETPKNPGTRMDGGTKGKTGGCIVQPPVTPTPLQGQAVLFIGKDTTAFTQQFQAFGEVCHVVR